MQKNKLNGDCCMASNMHPGPVSWDAESYGLIGSTEWVKVKVWVEVGLILITMHTARY